jgi:methyltransferase (TIGR00027 family)
LVLGVWRDLHVEYRRGAIGATLRAMAASRTAQFVALYRALETYETRRPPLFRDPYARAFLTPRMALLVLAARAPIMRGLIERYADRRSPGSRTSLIARTAYIDDAVRASLATGVDQLVILGAGFDCRAHRMPELRGVAVFEVDRPDTQAAKRARLAEAPGLRYVAVDFLRDQVGDRLAAAGWDRARRTMFVWEGVTAYLTEAAVTSVLDWLGTTAAGSTVVFTYLHAGLLDGTRHFPGGGRVMENVRRLGEPWIFGLHPEAVGAFVARSGLRLRDNLGADDYRRRYLGDAEAPGYAFYRIASADVAPRDRAV